MNLFIKKSLLGKIIVVLCAILSYFFVYTITSTQMLTTKLMWLLIGVLVIFLAILFLLTKNVNKKLRFFIGILFALMMIAVEIAGVYYVNAGVNTLDEVTTPEKEYAEIGVYVRKKDKAKELKDVKDYTFGIMKIQERDVADMAVKMIEDELKSDVFVKNYRGTSTLMDALLKKKEVDVIVLNKSFIDLLSEMSGHEKDVGKIREIYSLKVDDSTYSDDFDADGSLDEEVFSVYISGIDCYGSLSKKSRSDVNIIATVNTKTRQVLLISTPRDYYIPLSISNGVKDKLTHAGIYGINVSKDTLSMLYKSKIDYYFRVNFDGFKDIIDSLGGITVDSAYDFSAGGYAFRSGSNNLDGEKALAFARERYHLPGGDRQRGKNQMAVIKGCIAKVASPALLKNYTRVLKGIEGSFETNVPYKMIAKLVQQQLDDMTKWNVVSYSVNGTGASKRTYSMKSNAYVMVPKQGTVNKAKRLIKQVENGLIIKL